MLSRGSRSTAIPDNADSSASSNDAPIPDEVTSIVPPSPQVPNDNGRYAEGISEYLDPDKEGFLQIRKTRYMFTWNNYPEDWYKRLSRLQHLLAFWVGKEKAPSSGTPHLQGFMKFLKSVRITAILRAMDMKGGIWMQEAKASDTVCINYCSKGNQSKDEWTQMRHMGPMWGAGAEVVTFGEDKVVSKLTTKKPTQIQQFKAAVAAGVVKNLEDLEEKFSDLHASGAKGQWSENWVNKKTKIKHIFHDEDIPTAPWQMYIRDMVSIHPLDLLNNSDRTVRESHRRSIYFIVDLKGNGGKSKLTKWLRQERPNVISLKTGRIADMLYYLATQSNITQVEVIIVDATRQSQGRFQYNVLEDIKNGVFVSTKYTTRDVDFHPPHLLVMTNQVPAITDEVLSLDRLQFILLDQVNLANGIVEPLNLANGFGHPEEIGREEGVDGFEFTFLKEARQAARLRKKQQKWLDGNGDEDDF